MPLMERECDVMGAQRLVNRFSCVLVSAVRQPGAGVGVGIVYRTRDGVNVRKSGYVAQDVSVDEAVYGALLEVLNEAATANARAITVYLDQPQVVEQLNRRARAPAHLQPQFIQVRCLANGLGRVRFRHAKPSLGFAARRVARSALSERRPVNIEYDNPLLPLSFADDAAV